MLNRTLLALAGAAAVLAVFAAPVAARPATSPVVDVQPFAAVGPDGGYLVSPVTPQDIDNLHGLRLLLEPASIRMAVGRSRDGEGAQGAYIANVLKCRPPANRNPQPAEVAQCEPFLARQVALVKPNVKGIVVNAFRLWPFYEVTIN